MVKGISRQVIVLHNPEEKMFEQAIFILKDKAITQGITDDVLLQEARRLIVAPQKKKLLQSGPVWAFGGALLTGTAWLLSVLF